MAHTCVRLPRANSFTDMVKISVIVPVYNAGTTLNRCISSLLEQTLGDFELLLINDGSTDSSAELCRSFADADPRIKYFEKPNGGAASARNLGIKNASGEYLCFVDCDDYVENGMLEFFYTAAKNNNADIVQCGYIMENGGTSSLISAADGIVKGEEINKRIVELKSKNLIDSPCNKAYRRDFVLKSGVLMPENEAFEDTDFNLRLLKHSPLMVISEKCFYHYVLRMGSVTRSYNPQKLSLMKKRAALLKSVTSGVDSYCDFYLVKSVFSALVDMFLCCDKKTIMRAVRTECLEVSFQTAAENAQAQGIGAAVIISAAKSNNATVIYLACRAFYLLKYKLQKLFLRVR